MNSKQQERFEQLVVLSLRTLFGTKLDAADHLGDLAQDEGLSQEEGLEKAKRYEEYQACDEVGKEMFEFCWKQAYVASAHFSQTEQILKEDSSEKSRAYLEVLRKKFSEQQIVKAGFEALNNQFGWTPPNQTEQEFLTLFGLCYKNDEILVAQ